tara:strand:+ start:1459 stop:2049 length:591 start_codon:yes stop_codon:yes gene_type:complete
LKVVLASSNKGKIKEFNFLFKNSGFEVIPFSKFSKIEIPETGNSYEENAYLKAKKSFEISGLPVLADDSGLEVKSLNNEPGIFSARYAGNDVTDKKNNEKLLAKLKNKSNRDAKFVSVLIFYDPKKKIEIYTYGELKGSIGKKEKGAQGFGYDPLFKIKNTNITMAQISFEKRMKVSHRAESTNKMLAELKKFQNE